MQRSILAWTYLSLLALGACGYTESIVEGLGDAENAVFADDGRLFVTGGSNAYELKEQGTGFTATPLYEGTCNFTGVAVRAGTLYAACLQGNALSPRGAYLLAAPLSPTPRLSIIHTFSKGKVPNGIAFDARGRLLVADTTPFDSKVLVLELASALKVKSENVWQKSGLGLVNGLKVYDGKVWLTDTTDIKSIEIRADGSAGTIKRIATRATVLDDLSVDARGIVVADYLGNSLAVYSLNGTFRGQTGPLFDAPSSVIVGKGPMFPADTLVVTEKGAIGELTSSNGNRVTLFTPEQ